MLQTNTVHENTLELLKNISQNPAFQSFYLVGGTGLALLIGHRISIDLDFFTDTNFNNEKYSEILIQQYGAKITNSTTNSISCSINGIKLDFLKHSYPILENYSTHSSIRIASLKDIAAMKVNAIVNRGSKKDFVDLYFLLKQISLSEILKLVELKYANIEQFSILKSLIYFNDADLQPDCDMIIAANWNEIRLQMQKEVRRLV